MTKMHDDAPQATQSTNSARIRRPQDAVSNGRVASVGHGGQRRTPVRRRLRGGHLLHGRNKRDTVEKRPVPNFGCPAQRRTGLPLRTHVGRRRRAAKEDECSRTATSCSSSSRTRASRWSTSASATCPASMQHFTVPVSSFDQSVFDDGLGFDGSSIRGFQAINESDMALFPDPTTAYLDPFRTVEDAQRQLLHPRPDHRRGLLAATRATSRARRWPTSTPPASRTPRTSRPRPSSTSSTPSATRTGANEGYYHIDSVEGWWNSGKEGDNHGYKTRFKGGYFPVAPYDHYSDLRDDMVKNLEACGLLVERAHHEVGTAGQAEINYRFDTLLKAADDVMKFKYLIKNTAWEPASRSPSCRSRSSATTARACTCTSRCGRTASRCSTTRPATAACPTWPAGTSAASSSTPRRCWRSPTRR